MKENIKSKNYVDMELEPDSDSDCDSYSDSDNGIYIDVNNEKKTQIAKITNKFF